ncbi:hypothetical protein NPIL_704481 [Nephila pilipes]|uniref:Uncharacterized protein n=1 Tax=Nephila pilipes TaxID=299642 RepID=A0A8X6TJ36_NEPPI|nr:hypothetical protein NPIL_704481 [Nephila pilipes]
MSWICVEKSPFNLKTAFSEHHTIKTLQLLVSYLSENKRWSALLKAPDEINPLRRTSNMDGDHLQNCSECNIYLQTYLPVTASSGRMAEQPQMGFG